MAEQEDDRNRWAGLSPSAQEALQQRSYASASPVEALGTTGLNASALTDKAPFGAHWIPGVEVFPRAVYQQNHRGFFAEFSRENQGRLGEIGFWPRQWATARMYSPSAKGFHIHPPHIPEGAEPSAWFAQLFAEGASPGDRPYDREQWDVMFFIQGMAEMFLVDERSGMERRVMRFMIHGDNMPGTDNVGVVIPPGVAHAIRTASSEDLIMVYGTSTVFDPLNEGRIASGVESAPPPGEWESYINA